MRSNRPKRRLATKLAPTSWVVVVVIALTDVTLHSVKI
jgi:hypothetical protein